jgi:hypothetical protein
LSIGHFGYVRNRFLHDSRKFPADAWEGRVVEDIGEFVCEEYRDLMQISEVVTRSDTKVFVLHWQF